MVLKRIEIYGFKSFAQKSVIDFNVGENEASITAIVGPNGSGKSNIAEAVRWALGEQSYKLLRSKRSEDVIFTGSAKKQKGSFSEVKLVLDNSKRNLKIDFSEVEILRRLYRDGDNEYRLNGTKIRLMDILELLARCGFGQATYTVIGQGMVDSMLFYGVKERKVLFDEAAGVKQYELKREQSLRKLGATDQNLIRIKDILSELSPRLKHLKKQMEKAEERKVIETELKETLKNYYSFRWSRFSSKITEKKKAKEELEKEKGKIENELKEIDKRLLGDREKSFEEIEILRKLYRVLSSERDELKEKFIVLSGNLRLEKEKEGFTDKARFEREKEEKEEILKDIDEKIESLKKEVKDGQKELAGMMKELSEIQSRAIETQAALKNFEGGDENLLRLKKDYQELLKNQEELVVLLGKSRSIADIRKAREKAVLVSKALELFWTKVKNLNKKGVQSETLLKMEKLSAEKEKILIGIADIRSKISSKEAGLLSFTEQKEFLENRLKELEQKSGILTKVNKDKERIKKFEAEIKEAKEELEKKEKGLEGIREKIRKAEESERDREASILNLRLEAKEKQKLLDEYNFSMRDIDIEIAKVETRKEDLKEEIERDIGSIYDLEKENSGEIDEDKTEEKILNLRQKLAAIGGIDEEAEEEYKETEERHGYLSSQFDDLEKAKDDLKKIIKELDEKIKVQFGETFHKISKEFKKYFTILFDGGHADLTIGRIDDDMGTSDGSTPVRTDGAEEERDRSNSENSMGIEITACPPGKKVKSLNALSGGERSLTSLALLFAILSVNPSPFCVLDEVDAALDEANTKKFLEILSELSPKTQFVIITHNKDTMRAADILYGVTMDSEHVSKLLSLKLKEAEGAA